MPDPLERWPELDDLFERALEAAPDEREALLRAAAETDPQLRSELERLLEAYDAAGDFLDDPSPWIGDLKVSSDELGGLPSDDPMEGTTVGHFEVLDRLGEGGMGVVYRALDTRLDRLVALKFLNPPARTIPEATERLEREARAASALDHPNICTVHEIGETPDGRLYVAMAYYSGKTLRERLREGPLDGDEVVEIGVRIGAGLARAHAAGIVHRDLKPANVMLTEEGEVKVLDFGIAKREGSSELTGTGVLLGTVAYMSPEQARGEAVDHRTDIWSLGVTLYQSASGSLPFEAPTDLAALDAITRKDAPPLGARPPGLDSIVRRALAKDADDRYQSMTDMVEDLRALQRGDTSSASLAQTSAPAWRRGGRQWWWFAAAGAAVMAGAFAVFSGTADPRGDPVLALPQGPIVAVVPFENVGPDPEQEYFAKGLTEDLITNLGRFSDLFVLASAATSPYGGPAPDVAAIGRELEAAYALLGTVQQQEGRVRVTVRLFDTRTQSTTWSETFTRDLSAAGLFAVQDEITQRVAGTLGGSSGLIGRRLATGVRGGRTDRLDSYECVLRSYDYLINHSPANHAIARDCLEEVVAVDSTYVDAWGWLAYAYAEEGRHGWNRRQSYDPLDRALAMSERAIRLEPTNFIGQAGLAVTRFDRHEVALFVEAAEQAMAINPNDATWLAVFGGYMAEIGEWDRGIAILDKARALNPNHPSWLYGDYSLNEYRQGNYEEALDYALRINLPDYYRGFIWQVAAYGQLGRTREARAVYDRVLQLRPDLIDEESIRRDFEQYNHSDAVLDHVFEGIRRAGIWDTG